MRAEVHEQRWSLWCIDLLGPEARSHLARVLLDEPRLARALEESLLTQITRNAREDFVRVFCVELELSPSAAQAAVRTLVRSLNERATDRESAAVAAPLAPGPEAAAETVEAGR